MRYNTRKRSLFLLCFLVLGVSRGIVDPSFSSLLAFFPAKFLNLRFHRPAELLALVSFVFPDFALLNQ